MAYITLDFGSSNSGAVLNTAGRDYNPSDLIFVHRQDGDAGFTKQPTDFWIKRSLLNQHSVSEHDINIFSCVFYDESEFKNKANFIWCQTQIREALPLFANNKEWVHIVHPKMELYKIGNHNPETTIIKATAGSTYPLQKVLKIFFTVIKKECLRRASEENLILESSEINWGITVPGLAIWNQGAVNVIKDIGHSVFGDNLNLFSEPECALIGINIAGRTELDFVNDRYSLVVDLGGGTADICVMKETNEDGVTSFDEIKATLEDKDPTTSKRAGGNDIDRNFRTFFCNYLANGIELNDSPIMLYTEFLQSNPKGAMEFDKKWRSLQFAEEIDNDTIPFNPGRQYMEWLKTHYPTAARKVDEYGEFALNGKELRKCVFQPIYEIILASVEENLSVLKQKGFDLGVVYYAGGLSLDKRLKNQIKALTAKYFPYAKPKETSDGSVVGAIQRGGNHISVNKETLIRRMFRRTYYTDFYTEYLGSKDKMQGEFVNRMRDYYCYNFQIFSPENRKRKTVNNEIKAILEEQWANMSVDSENFVNYLAPLCLRYTPVNKIETYIVHPIHKGNQTKIAVKIFSSDKNCVVFKNKDIINEGEFEYDFGYNWEEAKIVFDPHSNPVEGTAIVYLTDIKGNKLKEMTIKNVSKRGY